MKREIKISPMGQKALDNWNNLFKYLGTGLWEQIRKEPVNFPPIDKNKK